MRFTSSVCSVPLPDERWYELLHRIAPGLPDEEVDIVEWTGRAEYLGMTLMDYLLRHYGYDVRLQGPVQRLPCDEGVVLLLPERDEVALDGLRLPCAVVRWDEVHPEEWARMYPRRLWITRFWFGGPAWLNYLGLDHLVFDVHFMVNRAWLAPFTRCVPWWSDMSPVEAYRAVPQALAGFVRYLDRYEVGGMFRVD